MQIQIQIQANLITSEGAPAHFMDFFLSSTILLPASGYGEWHLSQIMLSSCAWISIFQSLDNFQSKISCNGPSKAIINTLISCELIRKNKVTNQAPGKGSKCLMVENPGEPAVARQLVVLQPQTLQSGGKYFLWGKLDCSKVKTWAARPPGRRTRWWGCSCWGWARPAGASRTSWTSPSTGSGCCPAGEIEQWAIMCWGKLFVRNFTSGEMFLVRNYSLGEKVKVGGI